MPDLADLFPRLRLALDRHIGWQAVRAPGWPRPAAVAAARLHADQRDVASRRADTGHALLAGDPGPARLRLGGGAGGRCGARALRQALDGESNDRTDGEAGPCALPPGRPR